MRVEGAACTGVTGIALDNNAAAIDIRGRDVVLVNPVCGGSGDEILAKRIANIALEQGCRVSLLSVDGGGGKAAEICRKHFSPTGEVHRIGDLHDPLFIVAPVGIFRDPDLRKTIDALCTKYLFSKRDALLIEERDVEGADEGLERTHRNLQEMGSDHINSCRLGFSAGAIGYLPIDESAQAALKSRFEGELGYLFDSFNLSLDGNSNYHLAYINSDLQCTPVQVFLANTLRETEADCKNSNYVMVLGKLKGLAEHLVDSRRESLAGAVKELLKEDSRCPGECHSLFGSANIYFVDKAGSALTHAGSIRGAGTRQVNIVFVGSLPHSVFQDFICLSTSGMGSGDQSLGEFLSITGEMPHYDMQNWKYPLFEAVTELGESLGGAQLEQWVSTRVVGRKPPYGTITFKYLNEANLSIHSPEFIASKLALNQALSSRTADGHIRMLLDQSRLFV